MNADTTNSVAEIIERPVVIVSNGDWDLSGTLFCLDEEQSGPVVLMSSAAGVPQTYYRNFGRYLVELGAAAVLTYDYRGMSRSSGERARWRELRMFHWAQHDFVAAAHWLRDKYETNTLVGIGHSFGGQALGLSGASGLFGRYVTVATMSGYWGNLDTPYSVWIKTQIIGRIVSHLWGYTPKLVSPGEVFPGKIMLDWADWIKNPNYWFDSEDVPGLENFAKVTLPFVSLGIRDDPWGTQAAIDSFMEHFENAPIEQLWIEPGESGPIGHLGFFRKGHRAHHWKPVADYLLRGHKIKAFSARR